MRAAVNAAGIDGEPTLLLLEEHHLREKGTAILVSALIDKGEIPGLVAPEELDGMIVPLAELARREDFAGTLEQYLQHRKMMVKMCNLNRGFHQIHFYLCD